jgi:hypothetical protein
MEDTKQGEECVACVEQKEECEGWQTVGDMVGLAGQAAHLLESHIRGLAGLEHSRCCGGLCDPERSALQGCLGGDNGRIWAPQYVRLATS